MKEFSIEEGCSLPRIVQAKSRTDTFIDFVGLIVAIGLGIVPGLGIILSDGPRNAIKTPALNSLSHIIGWPYFYGGGMVLFGIIGLFGIITGCILTTRVAFMLIGLIYSFHATGFYMSFLRGGAFYLFPIYLSLAGISIACAVFADDKT